MVQVSLRWLSIFVLLLLWVVSSLPVRPCGKQQNTLLRMARFVTVLLLLGAQQLPKHVPHGVNAHVLPVRR